jgi:hypothetical protein
MWIIKQRSLAYALALILTAVPFSPAVADFSVYIGPDDGPYYYPNNYPGYYRGYYPGYYRGYYYPDNYVVVSPQSSKRSYRRGPTLTKSITTMKAQVALTSMGYYSGSVDGLLGSQTAAAIKAFQHNKDLAETGKLDDATLKALGVERDPSDIPKAKP